jgi:hypothetical protein
LIASALRATSGCEHARFVLSAPDAPESTEPPARIDDAAYIARPYDVEELRRLIEGD